MTDNTALGPPTMGDREDADRLRVAYGEPLTDTFTLDEPTISLVLSTGGDKFAVDAVRENRDRPADRHRVRITFGPSTLFIERRFVPTLVAYLNQVLIAGPVFDEDEDE